MSTSRFKNKRRRTWSWGLPSIAALLVALLLAAPWSQARAISRTRVMVRARSFVYHPWRCTTANLTASCDSGYSSVYVPGDYMGLPYDWGGFVSLFEFDGDILDGLGAGSYSSDGVLSCTTGLDCSGFVSKAWDTPWKYGTSTLPDISTVISQNEVLPGDCFNISGYHVILYSHTLTNGDPVFYETVGYNTQINVTGGWSHVSSYTPRRYDDIQGTTAGTPPGTPENPIPIGSFPFTDSRDTTNSESNVFDGCGLAPTTDESGPEFFYEVTFSQPGTLTVSVTDDVGVDIDVHVYSSMNTYDCLARDDTSFSVPVDCGTYLVVADTYVGGGGDVYSGPYDLTVDFTPSGGGCGSPPNPYEFEGELGDPCAFPGDESLPFCNTNLGSTVCLYDSSQSFCSKPCGSAADCTDMPGACCEDIGSSELYCLVADLCTGPTPDAGVPDSGLASDGATPTPDGGAQRDGGTPAPDGETPAFDGAPSQGDAGPTDGGGSSSSGCSCAVVGRSAPPDSRRGPGLPLLLLGMAGVVLFTLRRR